MHRLHTSLALPAPLALGITPSSAHLLSFLSTSTYVGSLYLAQRLLLPRSRLSTPETTSVGTTDVTAPIAASTPDRKGSEPLPGSRDHPETIRTRIRAVALSTVVALGGVWYVVTVQGKYGAVQAVRPGQVDKCIADPRLDLPCPS